MVIAIIAILAGMLLLALGRAKSQAIRTSCISNQKQIGIAYKLYVDDIRSNYPVYIAWAGFGGKCVEVMLPQWQSPCQGMRCVRTGQLFKNSARFMNSRIRYSSLNGENRGFTVMDSMVSIFGANGNR